MNKIGIIYSFNSRKTKKIAGRIAELLGSDLVEPVNVETVTKDIFLGYDRLILGVPTWFDGELPNYWDEFVPDLKEMDLAGKKVAIFGLADQAGYPENFGDAVGIMASLLKRQNAEVIGETDASGYKFESSKAYSEGKFAGLILDQENQARMTGKRLENWVESIRNQF